MHALRHVAPVILLALGVAVAAVAQPVKLGAATYLLAPKPGDRPPPPATGRTEAMARRAAPTNQWYSTLMFSAQPEALFAQPITVKPTAAGLELALPTKEVLPTVRRDVEIHHAHKNPIQLSPVAFAPGRALLDKASDWAVDFNMGQGADSMLVTVAHGSPYVQVQLSRGDLRLRLPAAGERLHAGADARALALRVGGKVYALFAPTGAGFEQVSPTEWLVRMPAGRGYLSAAALPDDQAATLALFVKHAYAFIQDTRVEWRYDQASSQVETGFTVTTQVMEGADHGTLMGLYPHHWFNNPTVADKLGPAYDTVRGKLRLLAGKQFKTITRYTGFVPHWPGVKDGPRAGELADQLRADLRKRRELIPDRDNKDNWRTSAYWQGKGLTRATQLAAVAEQQGDTAGRDQVLALVGERMAWWFGGQGAKSYFQYDKGLGTVVTYPDEFFAVEQMNDHHFHYGYWIRAAAELALRDPAWAANDQWGGMVDLLVSDIATAERGRADFPFLRNFDPYEAHSWASGVGLGEWGNNQESSSEAVNAWAGLILWAEVTGNAKLRDLGIYLHATEVNAINHYWFDLHRLVFPPEYKNVETSMLFGGKYAHNTWWTDEPRQIHGINLLPIAPYATYLGMDPGFVKRNMAKLQENMLVYKDRGQFPPNPPPADIWQDIFAKYTALADPDAALAQWNRYGDVEIGETRTHTLHWMLSLQAMGTPDFSVHADVPLYAVFKRPDGRKTHLAYNAGSTVINVRFSDGQTLDVPPRSLARSN
jgi:endoglucanase Acf2